MYSLRFWTFVLKEFVPIVSFCERSRSIDPCVDDSKGSVNQENTPSKKQEVANKLRPLPTITAEKHAPINTTTFSQTVSSSVTGDTSPLCDRVCNQRRDEIKQTNEHKMILPYPTELNVVIEK
jgi:hypothetical protein